ncbi:MAG: hypothetical protein ABIW82_18905 [Dokdonella sp.]
MKTLPLILSALVLSLTSALATAQTPAAPRPAAPPPVAAPPAPPPPGNAAAPIANPPVQGQSGTIPSVDAHGNAIPSSNPAQSATTGTGAAGGYSQAPASAAARIMPFAMLDVDKAGEIKMEQARSDPWLAQHFVQCDENHNEEVTQSEYEKCTSHAR